MNRSVKILLEGIGLIVLVFIGCIIGLQIERQQQKNLDNSKESISTIAVVNMDEGVSVGEEHINYASQLLCFPNQRFLVTGLSDAKAGIENGKYAAYIMIPETFSASVTSIENSPRKVQLEYQFNSKLNDETKIQAINDVNAFINSMNTNIAYTYVDAILREFHRIQDDSVAILANDNAELKRLQDVNIPQLIVTAEPIDEGTVDFDIQPVELTAYISQNDTLLESFLSTYQETNLQGENELAAIKETSSGVGAASANFFSIYGDGIAGAAAMRSELLKTAQIMLSEAVGFYAGRTEENQQEVENIISDMMTAQLNADQESANIQLTELFQNVEEAMDELQKEWESTCEGLKQKAQDSLQEQLYANQAAVDGPLENLINEAYLLGYTDALDALDTGIAFWGGEENPEQIPVEEIQNMILEYREKEIVPELGNYDAYVNAVKEILNNISILWDDFNIILSSGDSAVIADDQEDDSQFEIILQPCETIVIEETAEELIGLFELQAETEAVNEVIQTYFVDALLIEDQTQKDQLIQAMDVLNLEMEEYQDRLNDYDPYKYLENADLNSYLGDIGTNTKNMMDAIDLKNEEYIVYSTEVYQTTAENMAQLRNSLNISNEQTSTNVENCISALVSSREAINSQNISMLETFTDSLRYTRVESQGNTEVYDFIVNPLVSQSVGQLVTHTSTQTTVPKNYVQEILIIILSIGIVVSIVELSLCLRRQYKKRQENIGGVHS